MIEPVLLGGGKTIFPCGGELRTLELVSTVTSGTGVQVCTYGLAYDRPVTVREAACHCGQLRLNVTGDPSVVSICHCLACKRRTGSAFGMQAAFTPDQVEVVGRFSDFLRVSDEADRKEHVFHFCPECGSQVFYTEPDEPDLVVVSVGAFADPSFPPPTESGYDSRRHPWLAVPDTIERRDSQ